MFTVVQISDTHLSPSRAQFVPNWNALARWVRRQDSMLIINTGDVSLNGAQDPSELLFCRDQFTTMGVPMLCVPGNHDVGDTPHIAPDQPVTDERQQQWRSVFGDDWWFHDIGNWRLIGLNNMLMGTGRPDEIKQMEWFEATLRSSGDRCLALFMHRPAFIDVPEEPEDRKWALSPESRARLLDLVSQYHIALVASGHVHRSRNFEAAGTRYVWCPSGAFLCGHLIQRDLPGEKKLGSVIHTFTDRDVSSEFVEPDEMTRLVIDDFVEDVYPGTLARLRLRNAAKAGN
jgi:3',5'-cyclic AMP phosphodiesterase CpdA